MGDTIKFKRGLKSRLPQLNLGEPALVLDEKRLYIGGPEGNISIPNQQDIEEINTQLAQISADDVQDGIILGEGPIEKGWLFKPVTIADERNE